MFRKLIILLLLIVPRTVFCQNTDADYKEPSTMEDSMKMKIKELKNGALLIRLQTREGSIKALRESGKTDAAHDVDQEQKNFNKDIIEAFKKNFTFCPVYFFYSNYSEKVKNKKLDDVIFLNDKLEPDSSIKFNGSNFLTAEVGFIEQDTLKYYKDRYHPNDITPGIEDLPYNGSSDIGFEAIVIKDDQFVQLHRPFPYYCRTYTEMADSVKLNRSVIRLNRKLLNYYMESK